MKFDMAKLMQQAQKLQSEMVKAQEGLVKVEVEGSSGGGMVTVRANGKLEVLSVKIDSSVMSEDPEIVEDLILAAVNQALTRAQEAAAEEMQKITGGLAGGMPPGMKMPFPGA